MNVEHEVSAKIKPLPEPSLTIPTGDVLLPANSEFAAKFNRADFQFDHGLAHHPLFDLPSLLALANRIPKHKDFVYWQNGRVKVNDRWEANPGKRLTLEETILGIAGNDSLVILKHAEQDEVFGPMLQEILQRIFNFVSPGSQNDIVLGESLIFLNSPKRTTAYHLDLESNFLLQVAGTKLVRVHDCADRAVTPHEELENFCGGDFNGAVFKPALAAAAHFYELTPGHGVHFPSTAPHWVENGEDISISININFDLISIHQRLKRVYSMNRLMRRVGVKPSPPGTSKFRDAMKAKASVGANWLLASLGKKHLRKDSAAAAYPHWRPIRHTPPETR
jgi:hypothetical protein